LFERLYGFQSLSIYENRPELFQIFAQLLSTPPEATQTSFPEIVILNASFEAMHRAVKKLNITPELLLIDGNRFKPYPKINHECIIKGDGKYLSIAAASVLAKVERDRIMMAYHKQYPEYHWETNKGYPTIKHREAIYNIGSCVLHRKSFKLLADEQIKLDL